MEVFPTASERMSDGITYKFTHWDLFLHNMFAFAQNVYFTFFFTLVIPSQTVKIVGREYKSTVNGVYLGVVNLIHFFTATYFGIASDKYLNLYYLSIVRSGKRKPYVIVSAITACVIGSLFSWIPELPMSTAAKVSISSVCLLLS